jgi:hypothetical protein
LAFRRFERWLYRGHRPNAVARLLNRAWAAVNALGIAPNYLVTLEVVGRRSGRAISFPLVMVVVDGPDGTSYQNKSVFVDVVRPSASSSSTCRGCSFQLTVWLAAAEQDGKHRVTWRMPSLPPRVRQDQEVRSRGQRTESRPPGSRAGEDGMMLALTP